MLKDKGSEMLRKLKKTKDAVEKLRKQSEEKETNWVSKMQLEMSLMNRAKEQLESKLNLKVNYIREQMTKRRQDIEKKVNNILSASGEINGQLKEMSNSKSTEASRIEQILSLKHSLEVTEELLNLDWEETQMAFLKTVEHDFEAKHHLSGLLDNFLDSLNSLRSIYTEVQQYMFVEQDTQPHATQAELHMSEVLGDANTNPKDAVQQRNRTQSETVEKTSCTEKDVPRPRSESEACYTTSNATASIGKDLRKSIASYESQIPKHEPSSSHSIEIKTHCHMNVRLPGDKTACGITGIIKLDNDHLLMADYENSKLKLFSSRDDFNAELICEVKPRDMAKLDRNGFLVNFPMAKKMHFGTVETDRKTAARHIVLGKKIETDAKCCGIAIHNQKIYVATQIPHQILIMDMNGSIQKKIDGTSIFERATYISVDPDTSLIYISDPNRKLIIGMNEEKDIRFTHKVERPHGIVCLGGGKLFVADWDWEKNTVHLVNKEGVREGVLELENCYCPQKLVYDKDRNALLITQWQKDSLTTVYLRENIL